METGDKMPVIPEYLRQQYRELVREHTETLSKRIGETRAPHPKIKMELRKSRPPEVAADFA